MILLNQPSMVCNNFRMVKERITCFRMQNSWLVPDSAPPSHIIGHIRNVARSLPHQQLRHLVLHGHGRAGEIQMGCGSFGHHNVSLFKHLAGHVGHIWMVSCSIAAQGQPTTAMAATYAHAPYTRQLAANAGMTVRQFVRSRIYNGIGFCQSVAIAAQCRVTAADRTQFGTDAAFLPFGLIDDFEGLSTTWNAEGVIIGMSRRH